MKNGDMPASPLTTSAGALWHLRDGGEDETYIGQKREKLSIGFTKREDIAKHVLAALCTNNSLGWIESHAVDMAISITDQLLEKLDK